MRLAVSGLIYRKVKFYLNVINETYELKKFNFKSLKLNSKNLEHDSSGKIINLLSNDVSRIETAFHFFPNLFTGPLQVIAIILLLLEMIDLSIIVGVSLLIIVIPLQFVLGKFLNIYK